VTALNINLSSAFTPATSGSYSFSVTRDQIIRQAMLDIGALQPEEYPTPDEIRDCALKLNMMVKQWMGNTDFAPGLKVWTRKRADLFLDNTRYLYNLGASGDNWVDSTTGLAYPKTFGQTTLSGNAAQGATVLNVASTSQLNVQDYIGIQVGSNIYWTRVANIGVGTVTISAPGLSGAALANANVWNYTTKGIRPLVMLAVTLRDIYANDTPLRLFRTVEEYEALPTKTAPTNIADPTAVLYESQFKSQAPNGQLYLDVGGAQDVTKYLHCVYLSPVQDLVNPGDAPDYPQEWFRPLVLGHAKDIAPMFDCAWTSDLQENLVESLAIAKQGNPENSSVYFEVNSDDPYGP